MTKAESKRVSLADKLFSYLAEKARKGFGKGKSKAAATRKIERERGTWYRASNSGSVVQMSNRRYRVAPDGSFRRIYEQAA